MNQKKNLSGQQEKDISRRIAIRLLTAGTAFMSFPHWLKAGLFQPVYRGNEGMDESGVMPSPEEDVQFMVFTGQTSNISQNPGAFSCKVSFDMAALQAGNTAVAQVILPIKVSGEGTPSLRLFRLDASGAVQFVSSVTLSGKASTSAIFNITDFYNEHAPLNTVVFLIKSVPGPTDTIVISDNNGISLRVNKEKHPRYDLREILLPVWVSKYMMNETVLPVSKGGNVPEATLLFKPAGKVIIRNYALNITYKEGRDYILKGRIIRLTANSSIPFVTEKQLYPDSENGALPVWKTWKGGYLLATANFFNDHQSAVSYKHRDSWTGPVPSSNNCELVKTNEKLKRGLPLKVVLFGDSISEGADASGFFGKPPYVPGWGELLMQDLRQRFTSKINFVNSSKGGASAGWGVKMAPFFVVPDKPDLCIIAFGMNDGGGVSVDKYIENTLKIMELVKAANPETEFILVASMLPNENWRSLEPMSGYLPALKKLESERIAIADVWSMHQYILKTKLYCEITGNHLNHPNDFMVRIYAQTVAALFFPV